MKNLAKTIVLMGLLLVSSSCKSTSNKEFNYDNFDLAIMIEDGSGYKNYEQTTWPNPNEYALNTATSTCADDNTMNWDKKTGAIYLTSNKWDKCYAKFDKIIKISKIEDLVDLSLRVNSGDSLEGKTVELTTDLDFKKKTDYKDSENKDKYKDFNGDGTTGKTIYEELTDVNGAGFLPIGKESKEFKGNFDGNNHTLNNLYINNTTKLTRLGLFGEVSNSTIKNVIIKGEIKTEARAVSGGLTGGARNINKIQNISNYVNITSESNEYDSAGIVGGNYGNTTIQNCKNYGNISGGNNASGIVGYSNGSSLTIENCLNDGTIINNMGTNIGGILAYLNTATSTINIKDSQNNGLIKVNKESNITNESNVGGLIGLTYGAITIENSYNNGVIEVSTQRVISVGGIIGKANKELNLSNCYNLSSINSKNKENYENIIGGIVGSIRESNSNSISNIYNCYNKASIEGGNRTGGIVGIITGMNTLIINQSYNIGNITGQENTNYSSNVNVGGLCGMIWAGPKVYVLNSYNTGNLIAKASNTGGVAGGIAADVSNSNTDKGSTIIALNSYNTGQLEAKTMINGLSAVRLTSNYKINNFYNIGTLTENSSEGHSIMYASTSGIVDVKNAYYLKQDGVTPSNKSDLTGMHEITDNVRNDFVNILNKNKNEIDLSEYGDEIKDYKLANWVQGIDGYPVLEGVGDSYYSSGNTKYVKDLSGNDNNGVLHNIAKIDNEGVTTSDDSTSGYVDCGLVGHDFGDSVTLIVRTKINKIESDVRGLFGNTEGAGGEIGYFNRKIDFLLKTTGSLEDRIYAQEDIVQDKWYTIVATFDGRDKKLYIDGNLNGTFTKEGTVSVSPLPFLIGALPDTANNSYAPNLYSNITISDALIYDRALTEEEIKNNFASVINNVNKDKLLLWYKFA